MITTWITTTLTWTQIVEQGRDDEEKEIFIRLVKQEQLRMLNCKIATNEASCFKKALPQLKFWKVITGHTKRKVNSS